MYTCATHNIIAGTSLVICRLYKHKLSIRNINNRQRLSILANELPQLENAFLITYIYIYIHTFLMKSMQVELNNDDIENAAQRASIHLTHFMRLHT